jgi:hypothetical protein
LQAISANTNSLIIRLPGRLGRPNADTEREDLSNGEHPSPLTFNELGNQFAPRYKGTTPLRMACGHPSLQIEARSSAIFTRAQPTTNGARTQPVTYHRKGYTFTEAQLKSLTTPPRTHSDAQIDPEYWDALEISRRGFMKYMAAESLIAMRQGTR